MIEAKLAERFSGAAVLASMPIPGKQISTVESQRVLGNPVEPKKSNDARHLNLEIDRAYPVFPVELWQLIGAKVTYQQPRFKIVIGVVAIFEVDDLSHFSIDESEGTPYIDDMDGHIGPIQNENAG